MLRQRLRTRTSPLAFIQRLLELALALALIWYGLILAGLALDVMGRGTADTYSGYRTVYDFIANLLTGRASEDARLIAGLELEIVAGEVGAWQLLERDGEQE